MNALARDNRAARGSFIVDHRGTILGFDQAMEALTGWPAVDVVGHDKELLGSVEGFPLFEGRLPEEATTTRRLTLEINCRDGRQLEVEALADPLRGGSRQLLVTLLRVVARGARRAPRGRDPQVDELTRLQGAAAFRATLEADLVAAAKCARPLALILADVDQLRRLNDAMGHAVGDATLRRLAGILRVAVPDDRRLFRLADDDFAVLMPGSGRGEARQVAATLRSTIERDRIPAAGPGGADVRRVTLSLGAASFPADADCALDLVERAHEALDEARALGRNRVWCYVRRPRVPVQVPVFFDGDESPLVGYTRDLSPSGVFVQTSAPIEIGMRCALAFPLPGHRGRVHVIGRVVRRVPPEIPAEHLEVRIPGMGVEFERFGGSSDRRAIDAFLHLHESQTLRPETGRFSVGS